MHPWTALVLGWLASRFEHCLVLGGTEPVNVALGIPLK